MNRKPPRRKPVPEAERIPAEDVPSPHGNDEPNAEGVPAAPPVSEAPPQPTEGGFPAT